MQRVNSSSRMIWAAAVLAGCGAAVGASTMDVPTISAEGGRAVAADVAARGAIHAQRGGDETTGISVESSAFADGGMIPVKYTADGENVSPPLAWSAGPRQTISYA